MSTRCRSTFLNIPLRQVLRHLKSFASFDVLSENRAPTQQLGTFTQRFSQGSVWAWPRPGVQMVRKERSDLSLCCSTTVVDSQKVEHQHTLCRTDGLRTRELRASKLHVDDDLVSIGDHSNRRGRAITEDRTASNLEVTAPTLRLANC